MKTNRNPMSRQNEIVIQEVKNEVLVYDLRIDKTYFLNSTSASIWSLCDGKKSISAISLLASEQLGQTVTEDLVSLALDQLNEENLLEDYSQIFNGISRRESIRRTAMASIAALPLIISVVAPRAANALSVASACPTVGAGSIGDTCDCQPGTPQDVQCGIGGDFGGGACQATCTCTAGTVIRPGINTVIGLCS